MAEQSIIEKLKNRDESGMEELLQHYGPLMRYVIRPFLSEHDSWIPPICQSVMIIISFQSDNPMKSR